MTNTLKSKIVTAAVLGTISFKAGKFAVPCLDKELMSLLAGVPVGRGAIAIIDAWSHSWHSANLSAGA